MKGAAFIYESRFACYFFPRWQAFFLRAPEYLFENRLSRLLQCLWDYPVCKWCRESCAVNWHFGMVSGMERSSRRTALLDCEIPTYKYAMPSYENRQNRKWITGHYVGRLACSLRTRLLYPKRSYHFFRVICHVDVTWQKWICHVDVISHVDASRPKTKNRESKWGWLSFLDWIKLYFIVFFFVGCTSNYQNTLSLLRVFVTKLSNMVYLFNIWMWIRGLSSSNFEIKIIH